MACKRPLFALRSDYFHFVIHVFHIFILNLFISFSCIMDYSYVCQLWIFVIVLLFKWTAFRHTINSSSLFVKECKILVVFQWTSLLSLPPLLSPYYSRILGRWFFFNLKICKRTIVVKEKEAFSAKRSSKQYQKW